MSTSKHIDKICIAVIAVTLVLTILFMNFGSLFITNTGKTLKYESTIFDTSFVHQIDIVMNDWDSFIENCESEEYSSCTIVVDGNKHSNIAIRAKGNTSLSSVKSMNSQRYSFKLEFDHYESAKTLDGLDKLCLNNIIQDNTMMKDYIVYQMMNDFGVDSPLCSFTYITVNGEDWGLYLAVEGIEDSFLSRNYGTDVGNLYKPDSMSFGGGRGNGKGFNPEDFENNDGTNESSDAIANKEKAQPAEVEVTESLAPSFDDMPEGLSMPNGQPPEGFNGQPPEGFSNQGGQPPEKPDFSAGEAPEGFSMPTGEAPTGFTPSENNAPPTDSQKSDNGESNTKPAAENSSTPAVEGEQDNNKNDTDKKGEGFSFDKAGGPGGNGSDDVKLKYIDDNQDSYSNIFDNAKTDISSKDKDRLISSLKSLSTYSDLENIIDIDEVLRYFVVHNFVCNGDSYTGNMIHNYYLHESDGKLGMIPWDYNLAFGTFQGGNASSTVNTSIDSPVSGGDVDDRPMLGWIFSDEIYTNQYHELFNTFIEKWFTNGELEKLITDTAQMLHPYVEKDPTKFCTTEDFDSGVTAMKKFVSLRATAVSNQLSGDDTAVDTGELNLSDMGTMGGGMGGNKSGENGKMSFNNFNPLSMITLTDKDGNKVDASELIGDVSSISSITLADKSVIELENADMRELMKTDFTEIVSVTDKDGNVIDLSNYTISINFPSMPGAGGNRGNDDRGSKDSSDKNEGTQSDNAPSKEDKVPSKDGDSGFAPPTGEGEAQASSTVKIVLVAVSFVFLALGLLIAMKKKRVK